MLIQLSRLLTFLLVLTSWTHVNSQPPSTVQPSPDRSMVDLIGEKYDRMAKYLSLADLEKDVSNNILTFFVPTDEAFRDVPWSIAQEMLVNSTFLRLVIENHIIPGTFYSTVLPGNSIYSIGGEPLNFTKKTVKDCDLVLVNSIPILEPDQVTANGLIHGITRVILPQKLIDECNCGQPTVGSVEPTSSTTLGPFGDRGLPERIVAGDAAPGSPVYATLPPDNYFVPESNVFLRRSQAANPEYFNDTPANGTGSTTPFPYYNVWDDLVANHNLTTGGSGEPNKTREIEEERPRFFRTRLPSNRITSESPSVDLGSPSSSPIESRAGSNTAGSPPSSANVDSNGSPTPPPRFGLRRRVVIRPQQQPTPPSSSSNIQPYQPYNNTDRYDRSRPIPRPQPGDVPSVYYVEDSSASTQSYDSFNQPTYSPPLVFRQITSTTPRSVEPVYRVTSPPIDTRRRSYGQPSESVSPQDQPSPNTYYQTTTRRPYLRRPVPRPVPADSTNRSPSAACDPQDLACISALERSATPTARDAFRPDSPPRYDPRFQPNLTPVRESEPDAKPVSYDATTPRIPTDTRFRRPRPQGTTSTEYYANDMTTPSTAYFDSTRRPTSRNNQDLWTPASSNDRTSPSPAYEDDSVNYVRRYGAQRPPSPRAPGSLTRSTTEAPSPISYPIRPVDSRAARPSVSQPRPARPQQPYQPAAYDSRRPNEERRPNANEDANTIADILEDPGLYLEKRPVSFLMFRDLLKRAGLNNLASSKRPITIFLPTDDAFDGIENTGVDRVYRNPSALQGLLLRHIVNYPVKPNEMSDGLVLQSISNEPITIKSLDEGRVYANGAPILAATEATNGYVYVLGKVITEQSGREKGENVPKVIKNLDNSSIFNSLLRRANLTELLQGPGPWTVLVPENEAFNEVQPQVRDTILADPRLIQTLIGNHIINGSYDSERLGRSRNILPLIGQKPLQIRQFPGAVIINNQASIRQPDLEASNGIIHTINRVLLPEELARLAQPARSRSLETNINNNNNNRNNNNYNNANIDNRSNVFAPRRGLYADPEENRTEPPRELGPKMSARKFVSWLEKSGVLDQLKQNSTPYTVIIPTDEAVSKLPSQILRQLDSEPNNLKSLLSYHVIPGEIDLEKLTDGQVLKSLDDKPIRYNKLNEKKFSLSGAPVVKEYKEDNMKYFAVDRVLYPPHGSIFDIIAGSPILTNITQIIKTANLETEFSDSTNPYTLLAPTDDAFLTLDPDELLKITRDIKSSRDFLVKHTLRNVLFTSSIPMNDQNGLQAENIDRKPIRFHRKPNYVTANEVPLTYADITATNGVIHVLNKIL